MKDKFAILFSDLHTSNKYLDKIREIVQEQKPAVILFAGDIVNMGEPVWFAEKFIKVIDELSVPFLWVPGNNDFGRSYHKVQAKFKSLEGRIVEMCGLTFTGVGGSPASWAGQYQGEQSVDKKAIAGSIFISHVPPPGLLTLIKYDDNAYGRHSERSEESQQNVISTHLAGSANNNVISTHSPLCEGEKSLYSKDVGSFTGSSERSGRNFSDAPLVHICAHVHWQWGVGYLGQTKVIKLASAETGHYAILNLENLKVEFKEMR